MAYARAKSFGPFALHLSLLHPVPSPISRNRQNCGEWQNNLWGSTTYWQNIEPQGLSDCRSDPTGFRLERQNSCPSLRDSLPSLVFPMAYAPGQVFRSFRAALVLASSRRLADLSESAKLREWQNNPWGSITYGQNLEPQGLRAAAACFLSDSSDSFASAMMTQAGCGRIGHPSQEPWEACGKAGAEQMARSGNEEASGRRCAA
jgi:hypothetical protein